MDLPINYTKSSPQKRKLAREEYCKRQEGLCYHCNSDLSRNPPNHIMTLSINNSLFPIGFFKNPIHLHHNHTTNMTLGAVHAVCNAVLWQYKKE